MPKWCLLELLSHRFLPSLEMMSAILLSNMRKRGLITMKQSINLILLMKYQVEYDLYTFIKNLERN